jgi:quinol monooxygenase YgiN
MIHVLATIELAPGRRADFLDEFRRLMPQVHAEKGCIEYGPAIDVATSIAVVPPPRGDVVTVIEKWESVQALEAHLAAPHMARYRETVKDLVVGVEIRVLEPA